MTWNSTPTYKSTNPEKVGVGIEEQALQKCCMPSFSGGDRELDDSPTLHRGSSLCD